jgi:hypothetical protein
MWWNCLKPAELLFLFFMGTVIQTAIFCENSIQYYLNFANINSIKTWCGISVLRQSLCCILNNLSITALDYFTQIAIISSTKVIT